MQYTTVDSSQGICPTGWHLPSDDEIKTMEMTLGMTQAEADMISDRGTDQGSQLAGNELLWANGSLDANAAFGSSGFAALPGGSSNILGGTSFSSYYHALIWSSSESGVNAWYRRLFFNNPKVYRSDDYGKSASFSVRCVQD